MNITAGNYYRLRDGNVIQMNVSFWDTLPDGTEVECFEGHYIDEYNWAGTGIYHNGPNGHLIGPEQPNHPDDIVEDLGSEYEKN